MKRSLTALGITAAVLFASGCTTLKPFTQTMREDYKLSDAELKSLHYYLSRPIVMEQTAKAVDIDVTEDHGLRLSKGKVIDQVVIPINTSGVAESVEPEALVVSFEKDTALIFGASEGAGPKWRKFYRVSYTDTKAGPRQVEYDKGAYQLSQSSTSAVLMIDIKELRMIQRNRHVAPGRTLD